MGLLHYLQDLQGRQEAVACSGQVPEDQMPGLLTAKDVPLPTHDLRHVAVADRRPQQIDSALPQGDLKTHIAHDGPDDGIPGELAAHLQVTPYDEHYAV